MQWVLNQRIIAATKYYINRKIQHQSPQLILAEISLDLVDQRRFRSKDHKCKLCRDSKSKPLRFRKTCGQINGISPLVTLQFFGAETSNQIRLSHHPTCMKPSHFLENPSNICPSPCDVIFRQKSPRPSSGFRLQWIPLAALLLSEEHETKVYSVGWIARALTLFLDGNQKRTPKK